MPILRQKLSTGNNSVILIRYCNMILLKFLSALLVTALVTNAEWVELTGTFQDGQQVKVEMAFDTSSMIVVVHKPDHSGQFRETSNLHIFDNHLVAIKDDQDKMCFIKTFNTTRDEMKQRVEEAKQHNFNIGSVKKLWIDTKNLAEFEPETVKRLFGPDIACFCRLYRVVYVDSRHFELAETRNTVPVSRVRRQTLRQGGPSTGVIDSDRSGTGRARMLFKFGAGTVC